MIRLAVLLLLAFCAAPPSKAQDVTIPADGLALRARLALPAGPPSPPAVVALHGCGGPFPSRDRQWTELLTGAGHPVLFPDSFGSRGLSSPTRRMHPGRPRRRCLS